MSLTNLGLNRGPLVRTLFVLFIYVLESPFLMFLCLMFSHQQELNPKVVKSFQYIRACFEVWNFFPNFKSFFKFLFLYSAAVYPISVSCATACSEALRWVIFGELIIMVAGLQIPQF